VRLGFGNSDVVREHRFRHRVRAGDSRSALTSDGYCLADLDDTPARRFIACLVREQPPRFGLHSEDAKRSNESGRSAFCRVWLRGLHRRTHDEISHSEQ
jgi:hypothetical protein